MTMRARFLAAVVLGIQSYAASFVQANVVSLYLEDFQASGVLGYKYNGGETLYGSAGIFRLRTSDPSGPLASQVTDPAYSFCIELGQTFSAVLDAYDVGDLTTANDPVDPLAGPVTAAKRDLVRQLWTLYFDPSWTLPGPYTTDQVTDCVAFHATIYEILIDFDGSNLSSLDFGSGIFEVVDAYLLDVNDPNQLIPVVNVGNSYLAGLSLNYNGPLAELVALTNPEKQDFMVAIPEVSTLTLALLGLAATGGVALRRRRLR